jgi:hypothetical protein
MDGGPRRPPSTRGAAYLASPPDFGRGAPKSARAVNVNGHAEGVRIVRISGSKAGLR